MKKSIIKAFLLVFDIAFLYLAFYLAFFIRFDGDFSSRTVTLYWGTIKENLLYIIILKLVIFFLMGLYKRLWKYASIYEMIQVGLAVLFANTAFLSYMVIRDINMARSIYVLVFILDGFLIGGLRFSIRLKVSATEFVRNAIPGKKGFKRVMVVGGGHAGDMVIREIRKNPELLSRVFSVIDDDKTKKGSKISGVPVHGNRKDIIDIAKKKKIDEIIIAIPSAPKKEIREILKECNKTKCRLKMLPGIYEIIDGSVSIKSIRDVKIEDLLGREPVKVDMEAISDYIKGKTVLVTGGGGSIGSELCRQIVGFQPKMLLILDNYENSIYDVQNELLKKFKDLKVIIASVRDMDRMEEVFRKYHPEIIFHAAAHKHVPLMEENPHEAVKNNIFGTRNVAECAHKYGSVRFVLISTDKAVNPTNIMGATKRVAEMIIQAWNSVSKTEFVAVRFGNVLGSNGSVIPLFKKQIAEGGPVTVTHREVTRYFMTIPEAVQLVIQAGSMAKGGEIFVLDMGTPVKIIDLARDLIKLSGFDVDEIPIRVTGLRPGEKLYEELLIEEEGLLSTRHEKIFIGKLLSTDIKVLRKELEELNGLIVRGEEIKDYMVKIVPTYKQLSVGA